MLGWNSCYHLPISAFPKYEELGSYPEPIYQYIVVVIFCLLLHCEHQGLWCRIKMKCNIRYLYCSSLGWPVVLWCLSVQDCLVLGALLVSISFFFWMWIYQSFNMYTIRNALFFLQYILWTTDGKFVFLSAFTGANNMEIINAANTYVQVIMLLIISACSAG